MGAKSVTALPPVIRYIFHHQACRGGVSPPSIVLHSTGNRCICDRQGICTHIPQAENPELASKNQKNLCAVALPTRQQQDLLWVWPDAKSSQQAIDTPLPLSSQVDASKGFVWSSFVRDLEYDWQTLVENVADPSHVPFSHHRVQGDV